MNAIKKDSLLKRVLQNIKWKIQGIFKKKRKEAK